MKISRMNLTSACLILALVAWSQPSTAPTAKKTGPTIENALAADRDLAKALQNNDTLGVVRMLDKGWAVITSHGDIAEGLDVFPSGIRSGRRMLNAQEISEPRVRLFGNVALVTTKLKIVVRGKPTEYNERQTNVWRWKNGAWKCILTQESDMNQGNQVQSVGHYWLVLFIKSSGGGQDSATTAKLFQEHIHYMITQRETGKIITGGAFLDKAPWIGFEIYSCKTSEEVEKITEADPAISLKLFSYEIHPWATLKGQVKFE
jgi:ketosteroid isomerase-like protein